MTLNNLDLCQWFFFPALKVFKKKVEKNILPPPPPPQKKKRRESCEHFKIVFCHQKVTTFCSKNFETAQFFVFYENIIVDKK